MADETPITEIDELRALIAEGQEKGFLTVAGIASALEEAEVTKEQLTAFHGHLDELGVDVIRGGGDAHDRTASEAERLEQAGSRKDRESGAADDVHAELVEVPVKRGELLLRDLGLLEGGRDPGDGQEPLVLAFGDERSQLVDLGDRRLVGQEGLVVAHVGTFRSSVRCPVGFPPQDHHDVSTVDMQSWPRGAFACPCGADADVSSCLQGIAQGGPG